MVSKQEVMTQADVDAEVEMRKAVGLEARTAERHALRMQWYRGQIFRQVLGVLFAAITFAGVLFAISHFDWWTGVTAAICAGVVLVLLNIFNTTAQPPEDGR